MRTISVNIHELKNVLEDWSVCPEIAAAFLTSLQSEGDRAELSTQKAHPAFYISPIEYTTALIAFWIQFYKEAITNHDSLIAMSSLRALFFVASYAGYHVTAARLQSWWNEAFEAHKMPAPHLIGVDLALEPDYTAITILPPH